MTALYEFTACLRLLEDRSQADLKKLHDTLRAQYEQLLMDALLERHPGWSIVSGESAFLMFLYRNWVFSKKRDENIRRINDLILDLETNYTGTEHAVSTEAVKTAMLAAERVYGLSDGLLNGRPALIFLLPACHKREDAFCRCYDTADGETLADIYMPVPCRDQTATPQSILLHELGHVLTVAATGDVNAIPDSFADVAGSLGLYIDEEDSTEFLAHCFAMSLLIEPELCGADPFMAVPHTHKEVWRSYFMWPLSAAGIKRTT